MKEGRDVFLVWGGGLKVCCKGEGGSKKYVFQLRGFGGGGNLVCRGGGLALYIAFRCASLNGADGDCDA